VNFSSGRAAKTAKGVVLKHESGIDFDDGIFLRLRFLPHFYEIICYNVMVNGRFT
jgi:hypothetical protein